MDGINDQIDRLNTVLQSMMEKIPDTSIDRPTRMSIITTNWLEKDSDESSLDIPDEIEKKIETIVQELDRAAMVAEDFWSEKAQSKTLHLSKDETLELIHSIKKILNGKSTTFHIGDDCYEIIISNLDPTHDYRETTIIENSIIDCGHNIVKIRKEIALDIEKKLQENKNRIIEQAKANLDSQLEELDKLKQDYVEKLRKLAILGQELDKREKILTEKEGLGRKNIGDDLPEDPNERLKVLEKMMEIVSGEEKMRINHQINQLKSRIMNLRAEKVISESRNASSRLSKMVKTMEKDVWSDEKQRKMLLDKYTKKHSTQGLEQEKVAMLSLRKQEENFRVYMEKAQQRIKKREEELLEKERNIEENWMKVSGCKELIELMRNNIERLNVLKEQNDNEREVLEREKLDIVNMNERIVKVWSGIEEIKKSKNLEGINDIKEQIDALNIIPKDLGFT
ncbi:hypothetical protein SteCoe_15049 [Stentor coeruleus]|uniref:Uncharacterized protein n=1 Tax=Stentor coeruleus TaxID=5963 RepID=A0A1R2C4P9_9CILI|nr:hypothetical protein SteCoe_15049 [Stentor coeruleus]